MCDELLRLVLCFFVLSQAISHLFLLLIAFGDPNTDEYLDLKDCAKNPHRQAFGMGSILCFFCASRNHERLPADCDAVRLDK
jgi:hypothetical protein